MSLDVYLRLENSGHRHNVNGSIFIREDGQTKEITRQEWDERFPNRQPVVVVKDNSDDEVYSANITHNLNAMADAAGIYGYLWRPEENGIEKASQLIEPLTEGLQRLKARPGSFKQYAPKNGWGDYDALVRFVKEYLKACQKYPDAIVSVSR